MTQTIDRLPDINTAKDPIPEGCYIHEGPKLAIYAKSKNIPYGTAKEPYTFIDGRGKSRKDTRTIGIIVRLEDKERLEAAIQARKEMKAK